MRQQNITCPLCGFSFEPGLQAGCSSCPMNNGCTMVCCPACGYQVVDESRSRLVQLAGSLFMRHRKRKRGTEVISQALLSTSLNMTLAKLPPGVEGRVIGFLQDISFDRQLQLQAYGLVPGYWISVIQHQPVVIVKIENTEIALESDLANQVLVGEIRLSGEGQRT